MKFKELLERTGIDLKYMDLLQTDEWKNRRSQIIIRDESYCTNCGNSATFWFDGELYVYNKYMVFEEEVKGEKIKYTEYTLTDKKVTLHVHHKFYVLGKLPWEYSNDELITLCDSCHWNLHKIEKIKIYSNIDNQLVEMNYHVCERCNGAGIFPEHSHVQNGVCFNCNGAQYKELIGKPIVIGLV